jgi:site-specific recombinase XerD
MKYSVKFYPEKRNGIVENVPVMMSVTFSMKRMFYFTGVRCNINDDPKKSQWDLVNSRMRNNQIAPNGQSSREINAELNKLEVAVDDLFKLYDATKVVPTIEKLRNDLKLKLGKEERKEPVKVGFFDRFDQYMKDAPLSHGRKKHLKTTYNKVQDFNPGTTFENLNVQYLTDFQNYLIDKCNLSKNTTISELRRLRAFLGYAIKLGWTTNYPFKSFTIDQESFGDPIFITVEERDKLYSAEIENQSLAKVRDIFVFQCLIGCRVGDLLKLKKSNIVDGCIEYIASKTKDDKPRIARIPLTDKAKSILAKYDLSEDQILPFISEQKYNEQIKKVFKLDNIKITRIVTVADPKTRTSVQKSIADLASSHMARRVFVGNLHRKGIKNEIIASMSGHVENSKAFSRYYNIDKEDQKEALKAID